MPFIPKIDPKNIARLSQEAYFKSFKKEVTRAVKFGEVALVIFSDHVFSCGNSGTMLLLGKMPGSLLNYYKQVKKERSKERDFAKGICSFEKGEENRPKMRITLDDGKGKPARMKKNGRKLFKKLGFEVIILKGSLSTESEIPNDKTPAKLENQVDEHGETQRIEKMRVNYYEMVRWIAKNVVPLLKARAEVTEEHYKTSGKLLELSKTAQRELEKMSEQEQKNYAKWMADIKTQKPKIIKIFATLKKRLHKSTANDNLEARPEKSAEPNPTQGLKKNPLSAERRLAIEARLTYLEKQLNRLFA